jgi:hypothetical protein
MGLGPLFEQFSGSKVANLEEVRDNSYFSEEQCYFRM